MNTQLLRDGWMVSQYGEERKIPVTVPGSVYSAYLSAGLMEDPYWRDNEDAALALMEHDYEFTCCFIPEEKVLACQRIVLRFEGIDTVADVSLNGVFLGHADNMHRRWDYEVKDALTEGENILTLHFYSPTRFIREAYEKTPEEGMAQAMQGFPLLRKAHCMFGWDWGPHLPDAGLFRPVSLLGSNGVMLDSVYVHQEHEDDRVRLILTPELDIGGQIVPFSSVCSSEEKCFACRAEVTAPDGTVLCADNDQEEILITEPKLWWPNGYGDQPLYHIRVTLTENGDVVDTWERRIGLRTMTVRRQKDEWGESFAHEINGEAIFAMGEDYIPEDCILSRITRERTFNLLKQCRDAHFNVIRVWGGGFYPNDDFYDACDEYGLVVWQDFMFACAFYRLTDAFEESIRAEAADNIRRVRHHASLGLWCGNNEMEMFAYDGTHVSRPGDISDYFKMYEYILPQVVKAEDPDTYYWPASPSSGGAIDKPNDPDRGDVHYWDVWHGNRPFTDYRRYGFRYLSEFGFQSFPAVKTIETYTLPEERNIFSYIMERHQRNDAANGKIMNYMSATYRYPTSFETLVYASQLLQAEAIRYGVEHFRRNRGRCMGAVVWQLNDCWPVASWSSIDYEGRWKAVHYAAKRFFAPVLISCEEEGLLSQNKSINDASHEIRKSIRFNVSNETRQAVDLTVRWALKDEAGQIKRQGEIPFVVPALTAVWADVIELPEADLYGDHVAFVGTDGAGKIISRGSVILAPPKHFRFADPHLSVRAEGDTLVVTSEAYAQRVEIRNGSETLLLSDNYFDMEPGEERCVTVLEGFPEDLRIRSVYDIR